MSKSIGYAPSADHPTSDQYSEDLYTVLKECHPGWFLCVRKTNMPGLVSFLVRNPEQGAEYWFNIDHNDMRMKPHFSLCLLRDPMIYEAVKYAAQQFVYSELGLLTEDETDGNA